MPQPTDESYKEITFQLVPVQPEFIIPLDLLYGHSYQEALLLIQRLILNYGELLKGWSELIGTVKTLRNQGHRIAQLL